MLRKDQRTDKQTPPKENPKDLRPAAQAPVHAVGWGTGRKKTAARPRAPDNSRTWRFCTPLNRSLGERLVLQSSSLDPVYLRHRFLLLSCVPAATLDSQQKYAKLERQHSCGPQDTLPRRSGQAGQVCTRMHLALVHSQYRGPQNPQSNSYRSVTRKSSRPGSAHQHPVGFQCSLKGAWYAIFS